MRERSEAAVRVVVLIVMALPLTAFHSISVAVTIFAAVGQLDGTKFDFSRLPFGLLDQMSTAWQWGICAGTLCSLAGIIAFVALSTESIVLCVLVIPLMVLQFFLTVGSVAIGAAGTVFGNAWIFAGVVAVVVSWCTFTSVMGSAFSEEMRMEPPD